MKDQLLTKRLRESNMDMRVAIQHIDHLLAYGPDYEYRHVLDSIITLLHKRIGCNTAVLADEEANDE